MSSFLLPSLLFLVSTAEWSDSVIESKGFLDDVANPARRRLGKDDHFIPSCRQDSAFEVICNGNFWMLPCNADLMKFAQPEIFPYLTKLYPSVAQLEIAYGEPEKKKHCTTFYIGYHHWMTAAHCLCELEPDDISEVTAEIIFDFMCPGFGDCTKDSDAAKHQHDECLVADDEKASCSARLTPHYGKTVNMKDDWAIFELIDPKGCAKNWPIINHLEKFKFSDREAQVDDTVHVMAYPKGYETKIMTTGYIRRVRGNDQIYHDADTQSGSSGAPMMNQNMELIGMHVGADFSETCKDGNGNIGIQVYQIDQLIKEYIGYVEPGDGAGIGVTLVDRICDEGPNCKEFPIDYRCASIGDNCGQSCGACDLEPAYAWENVFHMEDVEVNLWLGTPLTDVTAYTQYETMKEFRVAYLALYGNKFVWTSFDAPFGKSPRDYRLASYENVKNFRVTSDILDVGNFEHVKVSSEWMWPFESLRKFAIENDHKHGELYMFVSGSDGCHDGNLITTRTAFAERCQYLTSIDSKQCLSACAGEESHGVCRVNWNKVKLCKRIKDADMCRCVKNCKWDASQIKCTGKSNLKK